MILSLVLTHLARFTTQQSRPVASLHSHNEGRIDRDQPPRSHPQDFQTILWPNGSVIVKLFIGALINSLLLLVQLLHKLSIRGVNGSEKLLKVIRVRASYVSS